MKHLLMPSVRKLPLDRLLLTLSFFDFLCRVPLSLGAHSLPSFLLFLALLFPSAICLPITFFFSSRELTFREYWSQLLTTRAFEQQVLHRCGPRGWRTFGFLRAPCCTGFLAAPSAEWSKFAAATRVLFVHGLKRSPYTTA